VVTKLPGGEPCSISGGVGAENVGSTVDDGEAERRGLISVSSTAAGASQARHLRGIPRSRYLERAAAGRVAAILAPISRLD
jgi:hypothetical protein